MIGEALRYLLDLGRYGQVAATEQVRRLPGLGFDYTTPSYKDATRRLVERLHPAKMELEVVEIIDETPSTKTLRFRRVDGELPPFRPGQYVNLFTTLGQVRTSRPYSLSSAPGVGHLDLTVRDNPGGFVAPHLLKEVEVGQRLTSTGPAGSFYHEPLIHGDDLVFLAGGSGITPFMSIIRDALSHRRALSMHLIYGNRSAKDVIFEAELRRLEAEQDRLKVDLVISEPEAGYAGLTGLLDSALIRDRLGELEGRSFYICGPGAMYDLCLAALTELAVPPHRIHRELYGPPARVTEQPGWPEGLAADEEFEVDLEGEGVLLARAGEPLLCSLEAHGVVLPATCRAGECSACRLRLVEGEVFMPAHTGLRESDRHHGFIHSCVAYPLSALKLKR